MIDQINIKDVIAISKHAGKAIMKIYGQDINVKYKANNSPLTEADEKAHEIIETGLSQLSVNNSKNIPVLSEEGVDIPYEKRKKWEYFWLVDPLDGTKEFIKKNGEFTVNIALIYKDTPILGVVYAPAIDATYWAKQGSGAFKNGKKLPLKTERQRNTFRIVASRSHMSNRTEAFIEEIETNKEKKLISIGSSLKICLVAEGEADIYPRLGPTMEWDTAASHAIVREVKGEIMNLETGCALKYNRSESLLTPEFVVKIL